MRLFIISLLLTLSEYNFYKTPPKYYFSYHKNNTISLKVNRYDPTIVSLVTVTNVLLLNKMEWIYAINIYNLKALMYMLDDDIFYIDKNVEFTNNICFALIALNIL